MKMPGPSVIGPKEIIQSAQACCEKLLVRFAGVDYDRTLLIDVNFFRVGLRMGGAILLPVVTIWHIRSFVVATSAEVPLSETFWVDRLLLETELRHGCRDEE